MIETDPFEAYLALSEAVPGWTRGEEARELMHMSYALPYGAELVEIGSFLGSGTILLAGARRLSGSGKVHCVDPFDGSGDGYSAPFYHEILSQYGGSQRQNFEYNIANAGLTEWVEIHQIRAEQLALAWTRPIDLLFLDGDQSREAAAEAYRRWMPFVKFGGITALHNSEPANQRLEHDGHRCVAEKEIHEPYFKDIRLIGSTTFAVKTGFGG